MFGHALLFAKTLADFKL